MSARYDGDMERPHDTGKKIKRHLHSAWGRTFLCTTQEVREALTAALLGIRVRLAREHQSPRDIALLRRRCAEVHEQLRLLLSRGDMRHGRLLRRVLRSYERKVDAMVESPGDPPDSSGAEAGE